MDANVDEIMISIANCESIKSISARLGVGLGTMVMWLADHQSDRYATAKRAQAEALANEIKELADTYRLGNVITDQNGVITTVTKDMVERTKLQIDVRKWLASKMFPKLYGDKVEHTVSGSIEMGTDAAAARYAELQAKARAMGDVVDVVAKPAKPALLAAPVDVIPLQGTAKPAATRANAGLSRKKK
jgi:hypothetical protein